jgi:hypothetical protein
MAAQQAHGAACHTVCDLLHAAALDRMCVVLGSHAGWRWRLGGKRRHGEMLAALLWCSTVLPIGHSC